MADGPTRYGVEIESLAGFLAFVDREMATSLEPGGTGVRRDLPHGQRWGGVLNGGLVGAARVNYRDAHNRARTNLVGYLDAGAAMLEVIKRLMDTYRTSEEMALLTTDDVLRLFDTVLRERGLATTGNAPRAI